MTIGHGQPQFRLVQLDPEESRKRLRELDLYLQATGGRLGALAMDIEMPAAAEPEPEPDTDPRDQPRPSRLEELGFDLTLASHVDDIADVGSRISAALERGKSLNLQEWQADIEVSGDFHDGFRVEVTWFSSCLVRVVTW